MDTPVRYEHVFHVAADDIDELDRVNHVVYLRWVQDVAAAHWESATNAAELARARSLWCPVHPGTGRLRRIDPGLHDRFYQP
jgi:acyl-CoA thioesterase FadM